MKVCLVPRVRGVGGMVSFRDRLMAVFERWGVEVTQDLRDEHYQAVLVIGGTRQLSKLWRVRQRGIPIVQRLDGLNWLHRLPPGVRPTSLSLRHRLRAELANLTLAMIRRHLATAVVYQSRFAKGWWERMYGETRLPNRVIYNGVDLDRFTPQGEHQRPTDRLRVLMVEGSLGGGYEWGLGVAVQFLQELSALQGEWGKRYPQGLEFMVVGQVAEAVIRAWDRSCGVQIHWRGRVAPAEIPFLDRSAHFLYSSDVHPACPNAVIEALACGLPVLAFETGALPELVSESCGRVVPYGGDAWRLQPPDIPALARAGVEIALQQEQMRPAARARAEACFDVQEMAKAYAEVLEIALPSRNPHSLLPLTPSPSSRGRGESSSPSASLPKEERGVWLPSPLGRRSGDEGESGSTSTPAGESPHPRPLSQGERGEKPLTPDLSPKRGEGRSPSPLTPLPKEERGVGLPSPLGRRGGDEGESGGTSTPAGGSPHPRPLSRKRRGESPSSPASLPKEERGESLTPDPSPTGRGGSPSPPTSLPPGERGESLTPDPSPTGGEGRSPSSPASLPKEERGEAPHPRPLSHQRKGGNGPSPPVSLWLVGLGTLSRLTPLAVKRWVYRLPWLANWLRRRVNRSVGNRFRWVEITAGGLSGLSLYLDLSQEKDYWLGTYEPDLQRAIQELVQSGQTAYDVGANVGYVTLLLARQVGRQGAVIAFEPFPANVERLKQNLSAHADLARMEVVAAAVVEAAQTVSFLVGASDDTGRVVASAAEAPSPGNLLAVRGVALDELVFEQGYPPPQVVKIDIEGGEVAALRGMRRLLHQVRPLVLLETHTQACTEAAWQLLTQAGYRLCWMRKGYPALNRQAALPRRAYLVAFPTLQEGDHASGAHLSQRE